MTTQQLEAETACVSAPPRCPNCGEVVLAEIAENFVGLAVQKERQLLKRVLDAHEQNQQSLAHQIHEGLAQHLIGALLRLRAVEQPLQWDPEGAANELHAVGKLLSEGIDEARRIASSLRPPALDQFGIVAGINYLTTEIARNAELEIEYCHEDEFARVPAPVATAVFRIVQELLTNACRHSQTMKVRVELTQADGHLRVEVQDWGIGFDPTKVGEDCFGLQEVRERAELLGGRTAIDSAPGKGTRVLVELPLGNNAPFET
jgi:signal transduction histidine kinase